tara:strand:- start:38063 stop:38692 length:630 start_codon:yes stop_codon:yes gene_type:complete
MKKLILILVMASIQSLMAKDLETIVLVPVDGQSEAVVVEHAFSDTELKQISPDIDVLSGDFDVAERSALTLNVEGRVSVFPMVIRAAGAVGIGFFENRVQVGVDAATTAVLAGEDGELFSEVGVYAKLRLKRVGDTYYIRGRAFKIFELNEEGGDGIELGVGKDTGDGFIELSVQKITKENGDDFFIPYISMGMKWGKPLKISNERYID